MASPIDGSTLAYEFVTGVDENNYHVAVARLIKHSEVEVRCYSIKELKEPEIIYEWKDFDVKKRTPSAAGAIIGGLYGGLPGAIGGALLASSKTSDKAKTLVSLKVKLVSCENPSHEIDVPLFVAMSGWEYDDQKDYREKIKAELNSAVRFANNLKALFQAGTPNNDKNKISHGVTPATEKDLGVPPLKDEKIIFSMPCINRGLLYASLNCKVSLTNRRLVFWDKKNNKHSYEIAMDDLKKSKLSANKAINTDLIIETASGSTYKVALTEGELPWLIHKINTYINKAPG